MVLLVEAYSELSDPGKRAAHDEVLFSQAQQDAKHQTGAHHLVRKGRDATDDEGYADKRTAEEQTWAKRLLHKLRTRFRDLARNRVVTCPSRGQLSRIRA